MNKNLKIAFKNRSSEQGFAIPIAVGMGLIMLLVSVTMIVRSQGDQTTASAQKATSRGLSAVETGITYYQSLINQNRLIAMYPRTGTPGWTTASTIPKINTCTGGSASQVTAAAMTDWRDVDPTKPDKGQYKLIDYTYSPTPGAVPGTGTLTVEGRVNQVDANNDGDDNDAGDTSTGTATSRLVVNIPVINQPKTGTAAGLAVTNVPQNLGGNQVRGNIVVPACTLPSGVSSSNIVPGSGDPVADPDFIFPDTPALPSIIPAVMQVSDEALWGETLPRAGDTTQSDGAYHYLITGNLDKNGGADITLALGKKVIFYVQGNIDIGGSPNINPSSPSNPASPNPSNASGFPENMQIYGNTFRRNANGTIQLDAFNKPLTKYGCPAGLTLPTLIPPISNPLSYSADCPTTSMSLNGGGAVNALIHAPDATGKVAGSGGGCDTTTTPPSGGGFIGAVWIKKWDRQSNNAGPMVCAYGDYDDYLSSSSQVRPGISTVTSWQRQEAQ